MRRWMSTAMHFAAWSKDRSRKVGAVIVGHDRQIVGHGYNGFAKGLDDDAEERHERPAKYFYTIHAEVNAILNALNNEKSVKGCTLYSTLFPCTECARAIIQAGITCVVVSSLPDFEDSKYGEEFKISLEMFQERQILVVILGEDNEQTKTRARPRSSDLTGIPSGSTHT
jgi:dCMP deaminase